MKVTIKLHNGVEREYHNAVRVIDRDQYSVYIYGDNDNVLAILRKGDVHTLLTDEDVEKSPAHSGDA